MKKVIFSMLLSCISLHASNPELDNELKALVGLYKHYANACTNHMDMEAALTASCYSQKENTLKNRKPEDLHYIGQKYNNGDIVPKNQSGALEYFLLAANRGYVPSQYQVGIIYASQNNHSNAIEWLQRAASSNYLDARSKLTTEQENLRKKEVDERVAAEKHAKKEAKEKAEAKLRAEKEREEQKKKEEDDKRLNETTKQGIRKQIRNGQQEEFNLKDIIKFDLLEELIQSLNKNTAFKHITTKGFRCRLNDEAISGFANVLKRNTYLKYLNLDNCCINSGGATELANAVRENNTLEGLSLNDNPIGDQGSIAFAEALKFNRSLLYLHLGHTNMRDEGIVALKRALKVNTTLISIEIHENFTSSTARDAATKISDRLKARRNEKGSGENCVIS